MDNFSLPLSNLKDVFDKLKNDAKFKIAIAEFLSKNDCPEIEGCSASNCDDCEPDHDGDPIRECREDAYS